MMMTEAPHLDALGTQGHARHSGHIGAMTTPPWPAPMTAGSTRRAGMGGGVGAGSGGGGSGHGVDVFEKKRSDVSGRL